LNIEVVEVEVVEVVVVVGDHIPFLHT